ncbi:MAG: hypothetical protein P4L22_02210 [Candidatus Babeliales bacterium]|nr:hypothetical protein [Candidatus Babeliales bacterium]
MHKLMNIFKIFCLFSFITSYSSEPSGSSSSAIKNKKKFLSIMLSDVIQSSYTQAGINTIKQDLVSKFNSMNACSKLLNIIDTLSINELKKVLKKLKNLQAKEANKDIKKILVETINKIQKELTSKITFPTDISNLILEHVSYDFTEIFSSCISTYDDLYGTYTGIIEDIQLNGNILKIYIRTKKLEEKNWYWLTKNAYQVTLLKCYLDSNKRETSIYLKEIYYGEEIQFSPNKEKIYKYQNGYITYYNCGKRIDKAPNDFFKYPFWAPNNIDIAFVQKHNIRIGELSGLDLFIFNTKNKITSMAWSPDSKLIACGMDDGTIKIDRVGYFNIGKSKKLKSSLCNKAISELLWIADSAILAVVSENTLYLWDISSNKIIKSIDGLCRKLCCSKCGRYIAYVKNGEIIIYDLQNDNEIYLFTPTGKFNCMSWALDSPRLAISDGVYFKVWDQTFV